MARNDSPSSAARPAKEPGRFRQLIQVFKLTWRLDSTARWLMIGSFVLPILVAVALALFLFADNIFTLILTIITGVLVGVLLFIVVLGRRAERAAYSQIAGQPGAVGAVLKNSLRRGWIGNEMPVAVAPRTQDAVYRAVGRGGVVLIAEGPTQRTQRLVADERRNVSRVAPNVPINVITVNDEPGSVPLHGLAGALRKLPKVLRKAEISAINNRLNSLSKNALPIPKGIDPMRVRAPRPR